MQARMKSKLPSGRDRTRPLESLVGPAGGTESRAVPRSEVRTPVALPSRALEFRRDLESEGACLPSPHDRIGPTLWNTGDDFDLEVERPLELIVGQTRADHQNF